MEAPSVPVRTKRGCLWYFGVAVGGASALLALLIAIAVFSPDMPRQDYSIMVSADDRTYLEVVTEQRRINGEGFLADYVHMTAVYYLQVGGWFRDTKRVLVFESGDINPQDIHFRHSGLGEKEKIEVIRCIHSDSSLCDPVYSAAIFTFAIPKDFDEFASRASLAPR